ncbi:PDZ domain-containing protein [Natronosporangium hydrolyticum]|uniref:endopeptidase La n=1 Tax=Natronosporangium hydrolyticum TaxID=2811111 RepID=A0A895YJH1_9ACTN|nr:PDZ domain-containing protein [Natronosporangium hydrolyticum]QSB15669.1 PDZ domain-containing protein [Natronosporangium hydrolyticum]
MQRRGITVLVGALIVMVLSFGVMLAPVPYVVLQPGPTWNTLGEGAEGGQVIEIDGADTADSAGELHLTTVSVQPEVSLLTALGAWLDGEEAVVPEELVYPPDQTREQVEQRNAEQFSRSQTSAEAAALSHLGYPTQVAVMGVVEGAPADGVLEAGDVITEVDGVAISEASQLQEQVAAGEAGSTLRVEYLRDGEPGSAELTTEGADDGTPRIGVEITHEFDVPFELSIQLDRIGGPSAGLMFALGIIDKLQDEDLTGGETIAGTGSIDELGQVGAIGGIPQKLVAARELGASAFLVPSANCAEALANPQPGLTLVRVDTLDDALTALADLRADREPVAC